jgi:hypothetical protein
VKNRISFLRSTVKPLWASNSNDKPLGKASIQGGGVVTLAFMSRV